jgi:signal transduction histidine kinase
LPSEVQPLIRALNRLMEQLRETLGAEQRFTADASHELRTPLSVIRTYAQVAERSQDPAETRQAFAAIDSGINRTARLLTQLLALSRLCRDSSELGDERGSLILATVETVESCRPAARAKKIELETRLPMQDNASVDMSPEMLETMLSNLLDNALKFTPPGGRVVVEILLQSDATCLVITDSGPGIPSAERERVFDRFYRANGPDQAGAGLGLSIVKRICDLHGVDIRLDGASAGPLGDGGSGLRVEVRFPPHNSTANGQAEGAHD